MSRVVSAVPARALVGLCAGALLLSGCGGAGSETAGDSPAAATSSAETSGAPDLATGCFPPMPSTRPRPSWRSVSSSCAPARASPVRART